MNGNCKRRPMTRPSSCLQDFQCRKLRYAEGLKRHLVDPNDPTEQDDEGRACEASTSKRRRLSVSDVCSRRFGTSIPPNSDANRLSRAESAQPCQEYSECNEETATRTKNLQSNTCSRCSKTFTTMVQLQKHATSHHVPYKCPLCSQTLSGLSLLKTHINSIHV
ncbi:hypothetical protein MTO96_001155 [Rhipicephalus appendiculatus]|uniref:C2H2-type domain-containing protein n=1 Tax=Rhipicephalus appendiculatus TaxID=34631 RepID=A0A131YYY8_RHIAP